jgi:Ras-related and estrogen-regulated growth inhibitor-like protein
LTVRYLTRRFIGEYRSNTDLLYKQTVTLESGLLDVEIIDVSVDDDDGFPIDQIQWADAVLIVYSITDRDSFEYAERSLGEIRQLQNGPATYLVANKADLDHLREVRMKLLLFALVAIGNGTSLFASRRQSVSTFINFPFTASLDGYRSRA